MEPLHSKNDTMNCGRGTLLEQWGNARCAESDDHMEIDSIDTDSSPVSPIAMFPEQAQKLPARCHSEPIPYRHNPNGDAPAGRLLEDWPRRSSCCSVDTQDWQSLCKQLRPRVTFSDRSTMHVYVPDPRYVRGKSYSKSERKEFSSDALLEAIRIKRLMVAAPGASTKDSFKYSLKEKIVSVEEIVGIEHLVFSKSPLKLLRERKAHSRAVVAEQTRRCLEEDVVDDLPRKLREFAEARTVKSAKQARIRAAIAA